MTFSEPTHSPGCWDANPHHLRKLAELVANREFGSGLCGFACAKSVSSQKDSVVLNRRKRKRSTKFPIIYHEEKILDVSFSFFIAKKHLSTIDVHMYLQTYIYIHINFQIPDILIWCILVAFEGLEF